jgi:hypothetical protein
MIEGSVLFACAVLVARLFMVTACERYRGTYTDHGSLELQKTEESTANNQFVAIFHGCPSVVVFIYRIPILIANCK